MVVALHAGRGRHQRGGKSSGFFELVALCAVKAHNLLAGEKGNSFGKVFFNDNYYLVENSYTKCALGPMKRYSFLVK